MHDRERVEEPRRSSRTTFAADVDAVVTGNLLDNFFRC